MNIWQTIITALGGTALLLGAVAWLVKKIVVHFLDKDVEAYKVKLQANADQKLEAFKTELRLIEFRSTKLHDKRAGVIAEIYHRLVTLATVTDKYISASSQDFGEHIEEIAQSAKTSETDFYQYFQRNRIFFDEPTCEMIEKYHTHVWACLSRVEMTASFMPDEIVRAKHDAMTDLITEANPVRRQLEEVFRKMLGVEKTP